MAIDYSQPGYKEMFANYGLTALAAQALEKTLLLLLGAVNCLEVGKVTKSDLHEVLDEHNRKTLAWLIKALRTKVTFPHALEADLTRALEKRNYVMHHFFLDRFDVLRLAESPEQMSQELRPIWELLNDVQGRTGAILEIVQKQFGGSQAQIEQEAKQLLKIYHSSNSRMEPDAP